MTRTLKVVVVAQDIIRVEGEGWKPGKEVYFGPDGVQGADARPPLYTLTRDDGRFDVTIRSVPAGKHTFVFWHAGDAQVTDAIVDLSGEVPDEPDDFRLKSRRSASLGV